MSEVPQVGKLSNSIFHFHGEEKRDKGKQQIQTLFYTSTDVLLI